MKPRDMFGLAVRLLGLWFLYLGLRAVTPLLDLGAIRMASGDDIINAILPVVFNLVVAGWLLSGGLLVRWAYPESRKMPDAFPLQSKAVPPPPESDPSPKLTDMERTEKRLASLVEQPKNNYTTQS